MTITFVGHGYVGLVTAAVFADLGNTVWVIGHTLEKIENLKKGILPIYEPGLEELVRHNVAAKRLIFTLDYAESIPVSDVVFIAVGTPPKSTGEADLSVVYEVAEKVGKELRDYTVVNVKSTVPVGTNRKVKDLINSVKPDEAIFDIASIPEFLREGQAISDTFHPDRIVIGTESDKARQLLVELHKPILTDSKKTDTHLVLTTIETAEMIKYAANAFLATKISFANAIAQICELVSADGPSVLEAIGLDKRIGNAFLNAGAGYGGSCFPKDVKALIAISQEHGYDFKLLKEVEAINLKAMDNILAKTEELLGSEIKEKSVAVLGLAFKPETDDMRDAPSRYIIKKLTEAGASLKVFDPIALKNAKEIFKDYSNITYCNSAYEAVADSHLLLIMTEWNEFRQLDLKKVKGLMQAANLVDGRNIYDGEKVKQLGFKYAGVGRK